MPSAETMEKDSLKHGVSLQGGQFSKQLAVFGDSNTLAGRGATSKDMVGGLIATTAGGALIRVNFTVAVKLSMHREPFVHELTNRSAPVVSQRLQRSCK